jgi:drug/metabolite transporter (DMT)-like permease
MVPILQLVVMRLVPRRMTWLGAVLCLVGLVILAGPEGLVLSWESGEVLTVISTMAIAVEIVMIGVFAPRVNIPAVSILQLACVAVVALVAMPILGEEVPAAIAPLFWQVTILMAMFAALMQILMNWAQQTVSPTRATLIYACEPVWAGIIGWFASERLGVGAVIGCGVILLGVLVSEWRPEDRSQSSASER